MAATSLFYKNDQLGKVDPQVLRLEYTITGAKTSSALVPNTAQLTSYDAIASQSVIDTFLGTTNEFLVASFAATPMGTDAFACIVNLNGQCAQLLSAKLSVYSGTNGLTVVESAVPASTTVATTLSSSAAKGSSGNVAAHWVNTGLDALTAGLIVVEFSFIAK